MASRARSGSGRRRARTRSRAATRRRGESFSYITVRVGLLPGRINEISLNGGRTVKHAMEGAEIDTGDGYQIRVNAEPADIDTELKQGDVILLVKEIEGNRKAA